MSQMFLEFKEKVCLNLVLAQFIKRLMVKKYTQRLKKKAAHLLYFLVKNHGFIDGNKRISAALFVYFLDRNGALVNEGI